MRNVSELISVQALAACYAQPDVVVMDCRFSLAEPGAGESQYRASHIPGSHYLHLDRDLSGPKGRHGGRHPLPAAQDFAGLMSALGVNSEPPTLVVAYDDGNLAFASRLWWLLRYFGHDRVKVLDGGFHAWREAGLPVSAVLPEARPGRFAAHERADLIVDAAQVRTLRGTPGVALVDSRETPRYLGLEEPIDPVAGHIEGALNFPWKEAIAPEGTLHTPEEQHRRWGDVAQTRDILVYCGSGVTACVNLLSLAEMGRADAKLYAGSWSDWCSYPELL